MIDRTKLLPYVRDANTFARWLAEEAEPDQIQDDLTGACAITSAHLLQSLQHAGIDSRIVIGNGHAFVRVEDWYLDATGEQFGVESVYIDRRAPNDDPTYFELFTTESLEELLQWMEASGWPWDAEKVYEYVVNPVAFGHVREAA